MKALAQIEAHTAVCTERHGQIREDSKEIRADNKDLKLLIADIQKFLTKIMLAVIGGLFLACGAVALEIAKAKGILG